jgi:hypothetical protein
MDHLSLDYTQSEASLLTGISQDVLRDWRRRGFLDGFGELAENGRWKYSLHDIIILSIARALEPNGQPISSLLYMAWQLVLPVINEVRPENDYPGFSTGNYAYWFNDTDQKLMAPMHIRSLDDLLNIPSAAPQVIIVNSAKLAAALPDRLQRLLRGENE